MVVEKLKSVENWQAKLFGMLNVIVILLIYMALNLRSRSQISGFADFRSFLIELGGSISLGK